MGKGVITGMNKGMEPPRCGTGQADRKGQVLRMCTKDEGKGCAFKLGSVVVQRDHRSNLGWGHQELEDGTLACIIDIPQDNAWVRIRFGSLCTTFRFIFHSDRFKLRLSRTTITSKTHSRIPNCFWTNYSTLETGNSPEIFGPHWWYKKAFEKVPGLILLGPSDFMKMLQLFRLTFHFWHV